MIFVTGASGYIGSHIARKLVTDGKKVRALIRDPERAKQEGRLQGLEIDWIAGDVTKPETIQKALQGAQAVIHTVAIAIEKGNRTYEEINFQGTVNVVEAAIAARVSRFINISQLGADPKLPFRFLASKGKAQEFVAGSNLDWTAFRPSVVWGPEDEFANTFARLVPLTPLIFPIVGNEESNFQPVWVEDVATSLIKALDSPETIGKEYEIGGPEVLTLEEIERRTLAAIGTRRKMIHMPMGIIRLFVTLMEALLPAPPVTRSLLELLAVSNVTINNAITKFVEEPKPFTSQNIAPYMQNFTIKQTISQFLEK
jgi:uncharacterized protein YbjT (DUF2867 family)